MALNSKTRRWLMILKLKLGLKVATYTLTFKKALLSEQLPKTGLTSTLNLAMISKIRMTLWHDCVLHRQSVNTVIALTCTLGKYLLNEHTVTRRKIFERAPSTGMISEISIEAIKWDVFLSFICCNFSYIDTHVNSHILHIKRRSENIKDHDIGQE